MGICSNCSAPVLELKDVSVNRGAQFNDLITAFRMQHYDVINSQDCFQSRLNPNSYF